MRVSVVCVLALLATLAAAQTSGSADPEIEAIVFKNWCKDTAQTHLDTSTSNQKSKQEAFTKLDAVTADLSGKFDKARDEHNTHNEAIQKAKHTIATLTKRIGRAEDKKKAAKTSFSGKFDAINWRNEKSQVDNIVASLATLHDATTVDLVKSSLTTYKGGIDAVIAKIAKLDAKIEDFDKQRRDTTASLNSLSAQSSRIQESYNFAKTAYDNQKKQSDAARAELKAANKALQSAKAAFIACVNKGHLPPPAQPLTPASPPVPTSKATTAPVTVAKSTTSSSSAVTSHASTPAPTPAPAASPAPAPKDKKKRRKRRRRSRKNKKTQAQKKADAELKKLQRQAKKAAKAAAKAADKAAKKAAKAAAKAAKKAAKAAAKAAKPKKAGKML